MKFKSLPVLTFVIAALAKYTMSKYLLIEINQGETSGMFFIQSLSENNYNALKGGEIRSFVIEQAKKPNCELPSKDGKIEIKIKKHDNKREPFDDFVLFMVQNDKDVFNDKNSLAETYVKYNEGFVSNLRVNVNAQECGIGKILMILCFNEEETHKVPNNPKNIATKKLETNTKIQLLQPKASKLKQWAMSKCLKLVYLTMAVEEENTAFVYFNSAIESGYTEMFIQQLENKDGFYPKKSDYCPTNVLKNQYTEDGCMAEGDGVDDEACDVYGGAWFFCQPTPPLVPTQKCSNL